jgi:hypothetical protein
MNKFADMTPEQRLAEIRAKFYRDHVEPNGGREQLMVVPGDAVKPPETRMDGGDGDEPGTTIIEGYGAVFNRDSDGLWFIERIAPGAFKTTIAENDVVGLFNHDKNHILGRTSAGTMELREDTTGLFYSIQAPDTSVGRDVHKSIQRGDITGSSFSFVTKKDQWEYLDDGETIIRTLIDVRLYDVGPVTFPAYPDTTTSARDMQSFVEEIKNSGQNENISWRRENARRRLDLAELE